MYRTSTSTVTVSTVAPRLTIFHSGGELPSAVSELSFGIRGGNLITHLEVERSEGVKYPFTYGVFLSQSSESAVYCIVMKPWFRSNATEGLLLDVRNQPFDEVLPSDISTYPQEKVDTTFGEREIQTEIPLSKLSLLKQGSAITEFYAWVHVWALGNERYLFDFIQPTRITPEAVEQTYTFRTCSTWIQTTTRLVTVTGPFTVYQHAPLEERIVITPALLVLAILLLAYQLIKKAREPRGQYLTNTQDQQT